MIPTMHGVESSNIKSVGYDDSTNTLHVEFKGSGHYTYPGVPRGTFEEMLAAESVGKYFGANIKGKFDHEKIEKEDTQNVSTSTE
jgi:hypothetical protein